MWYYIKVFFVIYCVKKKNNRYLGYCEEVLNEQALNLHVLYFSGGLRGASIIDSLDTLYIMGLMDEYNDAKEWVKTSLDINSVGKIYFFPFLSAVLLFAGSGLNIM